ncbi:MAG: RluA family pseudouridine synthase [Deltaproteobacteria bacterium]|nr:RluA family pseudouridine synthase [Deltaproteobacteria bacterium]MBN2671949.1 RluA family pseudouridine synthase [Deltaproteobacteria bacterium]
MEDGAIWKKITIEGDAGRVDAWLAKMFHQFSRRSAQAYVEQRNVRVNGRGVGKSYQLQPGDTVELAREPAGRNWRPMPNPEIPLDVVYEDESLIVVNKPWQMPSCANQPDDTETLANAIVARYPECSSIGVHNGDAGLLHRLDNDTSGLLIAARNVRAYKALRSMQENKQIEKRYLALVSRRTDESLDVPVIISVPLDAKNKGGKKMAVKKGGQRAVTHIEEATPMGDFLLVKVLIYKGVRHQIRVHLAQRGFPICGDVLYEGPAAPQLNRLFLHAAGLRFFHPLTAAPVEWFAPLPDPLQTVISSLT